MDEIVVYRKSDLGVARFKQSVITGAQAFHEDYGYWPSRALVHQDRDDLTGTSIRVSGMFWWQKIVHVASSHEVVYQDEIRIRA